MMLLLCLGYLLNLGPNLWFDDVKCWVYDADDDCIVIDGDDRMAVAIIVYRWRWVYDDINCSETIETPVPGWENVYQCVCKLVRARMTFHGEYRF